jgi:hypothetical protein
MKIAELFEKDNSGKNLSINDVKNHFELAKKLGVSVKELSKYSDEELLTLLRDIGFHDFTPKGKFNKKELAKGIKVEREHTKSDLVAGLIARDHLSEPGCEKYYSELEKMETKLKNKET